jgi:signal transduction histidine kinase/ligand-binding sensor domain-containing protein
MSLRGAALTAGVCLLAVPCAVALDPHRAPTQYVLTDWDEATGLPSRSIHALGQTRDRYLWLGTSTGLARFDGARFTVFDARHTPDFGDGIVSSLSEDADGTMYVGTTSAVMRYRHGQFETLPIGTGAGVVSSLLSARDGTLWVGLLGRPLFLWHKDQVTSLSKDLGTMTPEAMVQDERGTIWIGTRDKGLLRFENGRFTTDARVVDPVQALHLDRAGQLWIGTPRGLLRSAGSGPFARFARAEGLAHENVSSILEDRDGNLWVGTAGGGLHRWRDGRWSVLNASHGLADDDVRCLLEDDEGNLWIGTADGLNRLSDGRFVTYGTTEGLPEAPVSAVAGHADGTVWMGLATSGIARLRGQTLTTFRFPAGPGPKNALVIHAARNGDTWIGRDDGRLFRIHGDALIDETPPGTFARVTAIHEDEKGPLFFLRGAGLVRFDKKRPMLVHAEAAQLSYLYDVLRDRQGALWMCGSVGVGRLKDGVFRRFTQADGLPHDRVRSAVEDERGLWLATIGGLAYIEGETIRRVTTREGLPENHLRLVVDDGLGHLWMSSAGHLFRIAKQELHDLFAGRIGAVSPLIFDNSDGLRSTETMLSSALGFRGNDGRLWFATARGASVIDPSRIATDEPAPKVIVERFRVDGAHEPTHEYKAGRGELTAEFTTLTLRAPRRMRFRYRLDGFDEDWRDAGTQRRVHYGSLPAGRYGLKIEASNRDGVFGKAPPVEMAFLIRPPFHQTFVFYGLCAAALAGLVLAAHRLRVAQVHARFLAILGERTRIARELHDTLAQSLTGMGMQIEAALGTMPPELMRARNHLQRARSMVSASMGEVRRFIWVLRAQAEHGRGDLGTSLSASLAQLASHSEARLSFDVAGEPRTLPPELERNLLRIAHEAVTNAVRHSGAARIDVALRFEPDAVRLRVHDDGRGFDLETVSVESRGHHFGLLGMTERAEVMRGELSVRSRPGAGTEVDCRLPYGGAA